MKKTAIGCFGQHTDYGWHQYQFYLSPDKGGDEVRWRLSASLRLKTYSCETMTYDIERGDAWQYVRASPLFWFVVDRGIEPLCQDWESCILTIRWIDHRMKVRKLGDSNPRYGNPYGSLANCWFQPLTQTSLLWIFTFISTFSQMRCKGNAFILFLQVFCVFFRKKLKSRREIVCSFSGALSVIVWDVTLRCTAVRLHWLFRFIRNMAWSFSSIWM